MKNLLVLFALVFAIAAEPEPKPEPLSLGGRYAAFWNGEAGVASFEPGGVYAWVEDDGARWTGTWKLEHRRLSVSEKEEGEQGPYNHFWSVDLDRSLGGKVSASSGPSRVGLSSLKKRG